MDDLMYRYLRKQYGVPQEWQGPLPDEAQGPPAPLSIAAPRMDTLAGGGQQMADIQDIAPQGELQPIAQPRKPTIWDRMRIPSEQLGRPPNIPEAFGRLLKTPVDQIHRMDWVMPPEPQGPSMAGMGGTPGGKPPNPSPFPGPAFPAESGDKSTTTPQPAIDPVAKAVNGTNTLGNDQDYRARVAKIMQADRLGRAMQAGEGAMSDALKLILTTGSAIRTGAPPVPQLRGDSAGEAMTGRTAMQMRALENEENRELKKSQIESNNAYRQSMQEGISHRSDQNKLIKAHGEYMSIARVRNNALQSAKQIRSAIESKSQQGIRSIPILLQKAAGDSGNIAVSEQAANAGRVALYDRFKDQFTKLAKGEMTEEWAQDVLALVDSYEKANEEFLEETANNISMSYSYILGISPEELKNRLLKPGGGIMGGSERQTGGGEMSIRNKSTGTVFPATSQQYQDLIGRFGSDAFEEVR